MKSSYSRRAVETLTLALFATAGIVTACGDDEDPPAPMQTAGTGGMTTGGSGGKGGKGGTSASQGGEAGMVSDGGMGGTPVGAGGEAGGSTGPIDPFMPYPTVTYPPENPDSDAKAILGKILFWEEQL